MEPRYYAPGYYSDSLGLCSNPYSSIASGSFVQGSVWDSGNACAEMLQNLQYQRQIAENDQFFRNYNTVKLLNQLAYYNSLSWGGNPSGDDKTARVGGENQKITTCYDGNADDLNKNLKGVLAGKGEKLIELQERYGINAAFLAAVVNCESGYGSSSAAKNKNNVAGIMGKDGLKSFDSVDDCLEYTAKLFKKNYADKGLDTIAEVQKKYCPVGAENDPTGLNKNWLSSVSKLTDKYSNARA